LEGTGLLEGYLEGTGLLEGIDPIVPSRCILASDQDPLASGLVVWEQGPIVQGLKSSIMDDENLRRT
jgi:hypothetical protein